MMIFKQVGTIKNKILLLGLLFPLIAQASFIETTMGTAVLNDATASFYNPAALVLMKNPQIIAQGTVTNFHTQFTGQSQTISTGVTNTGSSISNTRYYSPSFYLGIPVHNLWVFGLAIVSNAATRDVNDLSVLRYVQANNTIEDYDVVPALAIKLSEFISVGGGVNFSYANFDLQPIAGFPGSNIIDSQSNNRSDGRGVGGNMGFLLRPGLATLIGFNYRTMTSYHQSGSSVLNGLDSNQYHFSLSTPARSILSINHFFNNQLGLVGTIQRIQWSTFSNVHVYGAATLSPAGPIIANGTVPYYLRNTWVFTVGGQYRMTPKCILRLASTYNQSPGNPYHQIANGDSIILGASMGYEINKSVTIDGSYAHAFLMNENIAIQGGKFNINGVNKGYRDGVSLKLTFNV